jgi:hypothetical protein
MDMSKHNRSIAVLCPTCGGTHFESASGGPETAELLKCAGCQRQLTKDDLVEANAENVSKHIDEIAVQIRDEVTEELGRKLREAFAGNKYIKIK